MEGQPPRTHPHGGVVGWCGDPERGGGGHGGQYRVRGRLGCVDWIWGIEAEGRERWLGEGGTRWALGEEHGEVGGGWEEGLPRGERTGSPSSLVEGRGGG